MAKEKISSGETNKNKIIVPDNKLFQTTAQTLVDALSQEYKDGSVDRRTSYVSAEYVHELLSTLEIDTDTLAKEFNFGLKVCLETLHEIEE